MSVMSSADRCAQLEQQLAEQRALLASRLAAEQHADFAAMEADFAKFRDVSNQLSRFKENAGKESTAAAAAAPSAASTSSVALYSSAASLADLEKENTKLRYRVNTLLRSLTEEEESAEKAAAAGFTFGGVDVEYHQDPAALATDGARAWARRTPLRTIFGGGDGGAQWIGRPVVIAGWLSSVRAQRKNAFLAINDGSAFDELQLVLHSKHPSWPVVAQLARGAAVCARGTIVKSPAKGQLVELQPDSLELVGACDGAEYALAKPKHSFEHLRSIAHLRPRVDPLAATMRVRSALAMATHLFFQERGFVWVHTPIITASDCEGAGEMFQVTTLLDKRTPEAEQAARDVAAAVAPEPAATSSGGPTPVDRVTQFVDGKPNYEADFFGKPTYLTVSGQLNAEMYACALGKVYTFGPTFRAENSHTQKHLAEFWMIEPEMAFADQFDAMALAEAYVRRCAQHVLHHCADDVRFFEEGRGSWPAQSRGLTARLQRLAERPFARCEYREAMDILARSGRQFEKTAEYGVDPGADMERYLTEEHFDNTPVIVYNYPRAIKSFYMRANDDPDRGDTVAAFDILAPGIGELVGGSQREERVAELKQRLTDKGLSIDDYSAYLDLRRFGTVPHSGFGLGFERLVMLITGTSNIRDVIPFPRHPRNADF